MNRVVIGPRPVVSLKVAMSHDMLLMIGKVHDCILQLRAFTTQNGLIDILNQPADLLYTVTHLCSQITEIKLLTYKSDPD